MSTRQIHVTILTKIQVNSFDQPCANLNMVKNKDTLSNKARQWLDLPMSDKNENKKWIQWSTRARVGACLGSAWQLIKTKEEDGELQFFIIIIRPKQAYGWQGIGNHHSDPNIWIFHQHHWWVGFNIFKNKEIMSKWSRSLKGTHILQVIWQVKAQNSNFASKTENRVEHSDLQRGCGLDQKVKRFERGKMLRDAKQF